MLENVSFWKAFLVPLSYILSMFQSTCPTCRLVLGNLVLAPQVASGKSLWAKWVADGDLVGWNVVWAFQDNGHSREWLSIRIDSGRQKARYFDLTTEEGRLGLRELERVFGAYLVLKHKSFALPEVEIDRVSGCVSIQGELAY